MGEITKIARAIKDINSFLITAHDSPCGDAIASGLALASILKRTGKKVFHLNREAAPPNLLFLPGAENIKTNPEEGLACEAAIVLDCANPDRIGPDTKLLDNFDTTINIDHHISNNFFGTMNYVDPEAASTGMQVFYLAKHLVKDINAEEAICLYTTLVMDTGSFKYSNTRPETHRLAAFFLEKGVDPAYVADEIYGNFSAAGRKLLGRALQNIRISECGEMASIKITRKMLDEFRASEEETHDFIDYIQNLKGVKVSFCLREVSGDRIKTSFRSKTADVDKIASEFGGGGHARAAGCSFKNISIDEAERKISEAVIKHIRTEGG